MHASIVRKLRMESRCHRFSLPHGYGIGAFSRDHLDSRSNALDPGRADEDHFYR